MNDRWIEELKYDEQSGLIPCIVQDAQSLEVLMLAYMNEESLRQTVLTGEMWFWSRSRQELWNKGATSGHRQRVVSLRFDCDKDALLCLVEQTGVACHTGAHSCFFAAQRFEGADCCQSEGKLRYALLEELAALIAERDETRPAGAYTTYLFEQGREKILKKIGEESTEVVIAAMKGDRAELTAEVSDLIYHLFVLLQEQKLPFDEVLRLLETRRGKQAEQTASSR
ncbi:bifunctional phosphoribosyl-AMP cyclohydrolase/phosphoribosyl-ATP diphosphatase HisIE [Tumebacillus lipolyticus]|uniref:Histidine biosynthesis bifunctional protein HisIE n=1 Tax=Tumebacillus lipolyticus TaxID=1280370 RepID=A0ABW5A146_9BACL